MTRASILIAAGALLLSGCSLGGKAPDLLLTLTPEAPLAPSEGGTASAETAIAIGRPVIPQALDTTRVPVMSGPTSIAYLQDAFWVDTPDNLFRNLLNETVASRTGRAVIDPVQVSFTVGNLLNGQLHHFGLDARTMEAVVTFDAAFSRTTGGVTTRRFEARVPVSAAERDVVAPALNQAANQVATQVADWVGR